MKTLAILFISILVSSNAWAFDRLKCEGKLLNWSVHTSPNPKLVFMNKDISGAYIDRKDSNNFVIKNEKGVPMASISPWNSMLYLKSKSATAGKYNFLFKSDDETYFTITMLNPDGSNERTFRCDFTF